MRQFDREIVSSIPTVSAAAYAANDIIGGLNTLSNICGETKGVVFLESVLLIDKAKQNSAISIFFFDDTFTPTSADNAPFQVADADLLKCVGVVEIGATDYSDTVDSSVAVVLPSIPLQAKAGSKHLYYAVVARGTPTYASSSDLKLRLGIKRP